MMTFCSLVQLIFADADIAMDVGAFHVYGRMAAGGPTCRLRSRLSLQFHERWWEGAFNQGILVKPTGKLDLHGRLFTPTWTRLATSARASDTALNLKEAVNWQPGQQLLITTTIWRDEWQNQNEVGAGAFYCQYHAAVRANLWLASAGLY